MLKVFLTQKHVCPKRVNIYLVEGRGFGCWPGWGHRVRLGIWMECTSCFHYREGIYQKTNQKKDQKTRQKTCFKQAWRPTHRWLVWLRPLLPPCFSLPIHFQNKTKSLNYFRKSNHALLNYNHFVFTLWPEGWLGKDVS